MFGVKTLKWFCQIIHTDIWGNFFFFLLLLLNVIMTELSGQCQQLVLASNKISTLLASMSPAHFDALTLAS